MSTDHHISTTAITALLHRAGLTVEHWDLTAIIEKTNVWISGNLIELSEMNDWDPRDRAAHLAEFGHLTAVDFFEQCVIEAGPNTAPWRELQRRVGVGDFDGWPPVWTANHRGQRL